MDGGALADGGALPKGAGCSHGTGLADGDSSPNDSTYAIEDSLTDSRVCGPLNHIKLDLTAADYRYSYLSSLADSRCIDPGLPGSTAG